ncbi:MAG: SseB family protein [Rhodobacter sp.]|nr:SseB family protein [Rhodobacter sp.]
MTQPAPSTDLDAALIRMAAQPEDAAVRLAFHAELSRAELFVLLDAEVSGDAMAPRVFEVSDGRAVLAFDSEMRLAEFAGAASAYAALPGRVLVAMLAGAGEPLSLVINPDADHAAFLPPEALAWLAGTLAAPAPDEARAVPESFAAPDLSPAVLDLLVPALERRLSGTPGLTQTVLAGVRWQGGALGQVLALAGLPEAAQPAVARAVAEALALSGLEAGSLDVIFPPAPAMAGIAAVGLALTPRPFVMPEDQVLTPGANPGMDPASPPKLR